MRQTNEYVHSLVREALSKSSFRIYSKFLACIESYFFDKNKRYLFIQIGRVHRYNENSLKTNKMNP